MKKSTIVLTTILCSVLSAALAALVTWAALRGPQLVRAKEDPAATAAASVPQTQDGALYDEAKLREIEELIRKYYIGEVDSTKMTETLAAAMIQGVDDEWSYYIPAEEYASYRESVENAYVGIGITILWENEDPQGFYVKDVAPDSPAYRAGIEIGDYLTKVGGQSVTELGMTETKNRVRGEEGTEVTVTVSHEGVEKELTITRERIKTVNVTWELLGDVAYIRIRNFEQNCASDAIEAIEQATEQGASRLLFDVRFNPGGLKREMVELLDYLLPEGDLFRSVDYLGNEEVDTSDARCVELPMAVLVNVDSYSAAEFFAAALQEYDAATVIGTQTYGKGRFQTALRLSDGSAVNLSIGKYTTPKGVSLVGVGITPDVVIELTDEQYRDLYYGKLAHEDDPQLQQALQTLREKENT